MGKAQHCGGKVYTHILNSKCCRLIGMPGLKKDEEEIDIEYSDNEELK
jgi:hypothetical protein